MNDASLLRFEEPVFIPALNTGTPIDQLNGVTYSSQDGSLSSLHGGLGRITRIYGLPNTHKTKLAMNLIVGAAERFPNAELIVKSTDTKAIGHEEIAKYSKIEGSDIINRCASFGIDEDDTSLDYFVDYLQDLSDKKLLRKDELTIETDIYNPYTKSLHRMLIPTFVLIDNWDDLHARVPDGHESPVLESGLRKTRLLMDLHRICCDANIYLVMTTNLTKRISPITGQPMGLYLYPRGRLSFLSNVALRIDLMYEDQVTGVTVQHVSLSRCQWARSCEETKLTYRPDGTLILPN